MATEAKVAVGLSIKPSLRDRIDAVATATNRSRSQLICDAVEQYLNTSTATTTRIGPTTRSTT